MKGNRDFNYASNEPKFVLARDLGDCRDNEIKLAERVLSHYFLRY